jgi:ABC-type multidrug transport system fused ATPase/permease subunit
LARKPEILILDEATSALDSESEKEIKETLASLHKKLTIIIIAHRLTTISDADKIIALENGRVVEQGAPSELAGNPDSYYSRALRAAA